MVIDPVCGMEVNEKTSKDKAGHDGKIYYFCSTDCRDEFEAAPTDYIGGNENDDLQPA